MEDCHSPDALNLRWYKNPFFGRRQAILPARPTRNAAGDSPRKLNLYVLIVPKIVQKTVQTRKTDRPVLQFPKFVDV